MLFSNKGILTNTECSSDAMARLFATPRPASARSTVFSLTLASAARTARLMPCLVPRAASGSSCSGTRHGCRQSCCQSRFPPFRSR